MRKISGLVLVSTALLLAACQSTWLVVRPDPASTLITVRDQSGYELAAQNQGTTAVKVRFDRSNAKYTVLAEGGGDNAARYDTFTRDLTENDFNALPLDPNDKSTRLLDVKLPERPYAPMTVYRVILDPRQGWISTVVQERSYRDVVEQGGAVPTRLVDFAQDQGITGMCLSPDGTRIVFSVTAYDPEKMAQLQKLKLDEVRDLPMTSSNLYAVSTTPGGGSGVQHITDEDFQDMYPSFTTDGKYLLFGSNRRRTDSTDILRTSAEGRGGIANVYVDQRNARATKPTQSKDGTITFNMYPEGWTKPSDAQVWTTGGANQFPTQIASGTDPMIAPDGANIAYIGADGNLWVVKINGSGAMQLTDGAAKILDSIKKNVQGIEKKQYEVYEQNKLLLRYYHPYSYPSWSPDGKKILFTSMAGTDATGRPNEDIWIMNADGSGLQQLTTNGSVDRFPLMSPDGKFIYFYSNRGVKWAIWRIPAP